MEADRRPLDRGLPAAALVLALSLIWLAIPPAVPGAPLRRVPLAAAAAGWLVWAGLTWRHRREAADLRPVAGGAGMIVLLAALLQVTSDQVALPLGAAAIGLVLAAWGLSGAHRTGRPAAADPRMRGFRLAALAAIVLLGAGLRLARLDSAPASLIFDEAQNMSIAIAHRHGRPFDVTEGGKEILFFELGRLWLAAAGERTSSLRELAGLLGTATIPIIYLLGRRLLGTGGGLATALVLALMPWHAANSRIGERLSLSVLAIAAAYALWAWALGPPRPWAMALAGLATGVGFYTWAVFKVVPLGAGWMIALAALRPGSPKRRLAIGMLLAAAGAALALAGPALALHGSLAKARFVILGEVVAGKAVAGPAAGLANLRQAGLNLLGPGDSADTFFQPPPAGLLTPLELALSVLGLALALARPRRRAGGLLAGLTVIHLLPALLSAQPNQRRLLGLIVPLALLAGRALVELTTALRLPGRTGAALALAAGVGLVAANLGPVWAVLASQRGEAGEAYRRLEAALAEHTVFVSRDLLFGDYCEMAAWLGTGWRYGFLVGGLPASLPLLMHDRRDVALFLPDAPGDEALAGLLARYPGARPGPPLPVARGCRAIEVVIPRGDLAAARRAGLPPAAAAGAELALGGRRFLPLDLSRWGRPWRAEPGWEPIAGRYQGAGDDLRLDDLARDLVPLSGIPFQLEPERPLLIGGSSGGQTGRPPEVVCEPAAPWPVRVVHVLGLVSPGPFEGLTPSVRLTLEAQPGMDWACELYGRPRPRARRSDFAVPYPVEIVLEHRNAYLDRASLPVEPELTVRRLTLTSIAGGPSLLVMAITLEGPPAAD